MDTSPEKYIQRLQELSKNKFELLNDYYYLTENQSLALNNEDLNMLKDILNKRQDIISKIDAIDSDFNLYFKRLKFELKVENLDEIKGSEVIGVKELQDIVRSIVSIINKISELDTVNNEKAKAMQLELGKEIGVINKRKTVTSAYRPVPINPNSYYFDKKK